MTIQRVDPKTGSAMPGSDGIHYYMPRPYVAVRTPYVIAAKTYLAEGKVSPDGKFVLITTLPIALKGDKDFDAVSSTTSGGTPSIATASVLLTQENSGGGGPQAGREGNAGGAADANAEAAAKAKAEAAAKAKADPDTKSATDANQTAKPSTTVESGYSDYKMTNDNAAFAVTPLTGPFDVLWLPDWDREYVIKSSAGVGTSGVTTNLGQGWSLQGFDAVTNNSALIQPLLDAWKTAVGALAKVGSGRLSALLGTLGGPDAGVLTVKATPSLQTVASAGQTVTLKITKARVVAVGIYKILKPSEQVPDANDAKAGSGLQGALLSSDAQAPVEAGQVIKVGDVAYQTYSAIVIEAATPSGDSAVPVVAVAAATAPPASGAADSKDCTAANLIAAQKAIDLALSVPEYVTTKGVGYEATVCKLAGITHAAIAKASGLSAGTAAALPSSTVVKPIVIAAGQQAGTPIGAVDFPAAAGPVAPPVKQPGAKPPAAVVPPQPGVIPKAVPNPKEVVNPKADGSFVPK